MAVGALTTTVTGAIMQWTDPSFGFLGFKVAGFNAAMMALVGTMIGAFSQMGFFAYLILNYIALSIFRKKIFMERFSGLHDCILHHRAWYMLFNKREILSSYLFIIVPAVLVLGTLAVCFFKVKQTNPSAFIPTAFLMFTVTFIEAWPAMSDGNANTPGIIFMFVPLFVCNAYQIMMLHRVLKNKTTESASEANTVA